MRVINKIVVKKTTSFGSLKLKKFKRVCKYSNSLTSLGLAKTLRNGITAPKLKISKIDAISIKNNNKRACLFLMIGRLSQRVSIFFFKISSYKEIVELCDINKGSIAK